MDRYPWRDTSSDIAGGQPPQWETPQGAQAKADKAEAAANKYTDEKNTDFTAHIQNTVIHVTQANKDDWNSKAAGNHTHPNATETTPGFMSAADKTKLDGVADRANNYVHPATHPPSIIAQDSGNRFVTDAEKVAWNGKANTTEASTTAKGLMSVADKVKLDGIEPKAEVNQNAFAAIKAAGQSDVVAGVEQDAINLAGGTGITITTDPAAKRVMITATGEATPGPHASSHITGGTDVIPDAVTDGASGLMSGADARFVRADGETKTGAQEKADAAEADAKRYTDDRIADVIPSAEKGAANGVAALGTDSKVPAAQLPISTATNDTSQTKVASASAVKAAFDLANSGMLPRVYSGLTDFNSFTTAGMYTIGEASQLSNNFGVAGWGLLFVEATNQPYLVQRFFSIGSGSRIFVRGRSEGATSWTAWKELFTTSGGAMVGTIASTNGIPLVSVIPGQTSWILHNSSNGGFYISPSNTNGGNDWNFDKGIRISRDGVIFSTSSGSILAENLVEMFRGVGSPEGVVAAPVGALYRNRVGGAGSTLYIKESGSGNTGWRAV
ncbi:pyocin knob domain-containing protein [Paenibacillus medicaginis]|uniref:Pyocin knob domain-containing protein n=1 Tax=Paenibacillus medicaginis TaxID=1470560 RepID=A0ABV5C103_9BACL